MEFIERVIYINLDHRTDRRAQIESELACFGDRVERLSATRHATGGIGCSMSHIRALQRAKEAGWKNVLIVEDDFAWTNREAGEACLTRLASQPYDVILLGAVNGKCDSTLRVSDAQTATGYLVAAHYYDTLLANFRESLEGFLRTGTYGTYALDQYWKRLQPTGQWFLVRPGLCTQRPSYSDIEKRVVDYRRAFA